MNKNTFRIEKNSFSRNIHESVFLKIWIHFNPFQSILVCWVCGTCGRKHSGRVLPSPKERHPFVCSSRFLNSIALVVWRTLIHLRWTHSSLYIGERCQWISSSYYQQLKNARNLCLSLSMRQSGIQNTVDSSS